MPGGSRACQGQAVSWLHPCWPPGSVLSWKPSVTLDMTLWKCLCGAVQHGHCASAAVLLCGLELPRWGQGAQPGPGAALKPPGVALVLCCPHRPILVSVQVPWSPPVPMHRTGLARTNLRLHGPDKHHFWAWFRTNRLIHTIACRSDACWVDLSTLLLG